MCELLLCTELFILVEWGGLALLVKLELVPSVISFGMNFEL